MVWYCTFTLAISSFSMFVNFQVENNPYDPSLMVFMDYRDFPTKKECCPEEEYPTFLYVMPMSSTRVFFEVSTYSGCRPPIHIYMSNLMAICLQETCLASKEAMPFDLLKKKLMSRLDAMGVRVLKVYEEVR